MHVSDDNRKGLEPSSQSTELLYTTRKRSVASQSSCAVSFSFIMITVHGINVNVSLLSEAQQANGIFCGQVSTMKSALSRLLFQVRV